MASGFSWVCGITGDQKEVRKELRTETLQAKFSQRLTLNKSLLNKQKNDKKEHVGE